MTERSAPRSERAAALRDAFDSAFSQPPPMARTQADDVLAIRIGHDQYAVRLSDVSGLVKDKPLTRLPGREPALLGLASVRGMIVSVYDLATLMGSSAGGVPCWLVLPAADRTIGLAFDHLDGYLRVPRDAVAVEEHSAPRQSPTREVVRIGAVVRPIVSIPALIGEIMIRVRHEPLRKEP